MIILVWSDSSFAVLEGWVESQRLRMTLREKIAQMIIIDTKETSFTPEIRDRLRKYKFGGVLFFEKNLVSRHQAKILISQMKNDVMIRTGIPLLVAVDQEGGLVNRLGAISDNKLLTHGARKLGNLYSWNSKKAGPLISTLARQTAHELNDTGFNLNLAPVLDLAGKPEAYIFPRSYGNDPKQVTAITRRITKWHKTYGIGTTGKHFPNLTATQIDSHIGLPYIGHDIKRLRRHEFLPFKKMKRELDAIMVGHVMVPAIDDKFPSSISRKTIQLLRKEIGYKGVVITDDLKMGALTSKYPFHEIILRAVSAGADMLILATKEAKENHTIDIIEFAVKKGIISERQIDASVDRILSMKYKLHLRKSRPRGSIDMESHFVPGY